MAINPTNHQNMIVAWMGFLFGENVVIKTKSTFDGGQSWSSVVSQPHYVSGFTSADPSVEFDHQGNAYLCFIDFDGTSFSDGSVRVAKSTDGGLTWSTAVEVIALADDPGKLCIDRPWISIDTSSGPSQGNVYVTTMNADKLPVSPPYNPYFVRSTDGGASFGTPRYIDSTDYLAGSIITQPMPYPTVSATGKLYACYPSYETSQSLFPQIFVASSSDGGIGFNYNTMYTGANVANDSLIKRPSPIICDPSDPLHLTYCGVMDYHGDADVYMLESFDEGISWTTPARINDDAIGNGRLQDLIWCDYDYDGDLAVCWRDRRNGGAGYETDTEIWCSMRCKDSTAFTPNFRISDTQVSHDTILNSAGNDAMCVKFLNDTINAVWGDVRTGRLNIFFNRVSKQTIVSATEIVSEQTPLPIYPNPGNGNITVPAVDPPFSFEIIDVQGKLLNHGKSNTNLLNTGLDVGQYFIRINGNRVYQFLVQ